MSYEDKNNETIISAEDFRLVQENAKISDKKLETKATTFMKDAFKRFCKNKSSVVAAIILGILILLAIFVPIISTYDITTVRKSESFLAPKLFNAGTGWWDGTRKVNHVVYDTVNETPAGYDKTAVLNLVIDENPTLVDQAQSNGFGGMVVFASDKKAASSFYLRSSAIDFTDSDNFVLNTKLVDKQDVQAGKLTEYAISLVYVEAEETKRITLKDFSSEYGEVSVNISEKLAELGLSTLNAKVEFEIKGSEESITYILFESLNIATTSANEDVKALVEKISFDDATKMVLRPKDFTNEETEGKVPNEAYWVCTGRKGIHESNLYYCSFRYDTYAAAYNEQTYSFAYSDVQKYIDNGWCEFTPIYVPGVYPKELDVEATKATFKVLDKKCPISSIDSFETNDITGKILTIKGKSYRYQAYGYSRMPRFILGTDVNGHDIFKKAFKGLRTSLILGVCTAAFCFAFGIVWGSISGYFGGSVDIIMERFCEILSGVPWIVIMTLCILHFGNGFGTFVFALCLTGWMGTAGRTRTQFYRFKGREYVLASRTLGSSDMRLIFKHILPNSLGTIITSSVLMIPSVIFSEATLAYLNLGLQGVESFGVMMSDNQQYLSAYPNLVIFPACIIALMMISFNLFGNGLRDAVNPSLKGSE